MALQAILTCIQFLVPAFAGLEGKQEAAVAGCVAALQLLISKIAHGYTESGEKLVSASAEVITLPTVEVKKETK